MSERRECFDRLANDVGESFAVLEAAFEKVKRCVDDGVTPDVMRPICEDFEDRARRFMTRFHHFYYWWMDVGNLDGLFSAKKDGE